MNSFTHTSKKFGDTFNVFVDEKSGEFIGAHRYLGNITVSGAIVYEHFDLIPEPFKTEISELVEQRKRALGK